MAKEHMERQFQSTLPHGERQQITKDRVTDVKFQSTLPHGERPDTIYHGASGCEVSIHAPTWGATHCCLQHAAIQRVSIHAPTWGATALPLVGQSQPPSFNPRSHMGSDLRIVGNAEVRPMFQSTLPHGERLV